VASRSAIAVVLGALALGCAPGGDGAPEPGGGGKADDPFTLPARLPRRIIWLIGDGMGTAHLAGAAYTADRPLATLGMAERGLVATHEHEFVTTDSAASATALATGEKSHFGAIAVRAGTRRAGEDDPASHLETVIELAESLDWKTGLVATTTVVDATPAAFAAHRAQRASKREIALDLVASGVDVLLGGGRDFFVDRPDGRDLEAELAAGGCAVARDAATLADQAKRASCLVALLAPGDLPSVASGQRPVALPELTRHALAVLDHGDPAGFFLMVEGSQIDRASHGLEAVDSLAETRELDDAVAVALAYARGRDDTLVIVGADHETGGLAILDPAAATARLDALGGPVAARALTAFRGDRGPNPWQLVPRGAAFPAGEASATIAPVYGFLSPASRPMWSGLPAFFFATHTPALVPVFAEGPGAALAASAWDNAALGDRVRAMVRASGEAPPPGGDDDRDDDDRDDRVPASIVLFVTDGLGAQLLGAATYTRGPLALRAMAATGLVTTAGHDRLVPDPAAAATALALGVATRAGAIGQRPDGDRLVAATSLRELAEASGRATGLVTSADLADPAVAAFYAHGAAPREALIDALIDQPAGDGIDLVFGGGRAGFSSEDIARWRARGVTVATRWSSGAATSTQQLARLVADDALAPATERLAGGEQPSLEAMTRTALASLRKRPAGFVLVVHAGGAARALGDLERGEALLDEVVDLDRAVAAALEHAAARGDTLVAVTSLRDSGLSVLDNHYGFHRKHCGAATLCGGGFELLPLPVRIEGVARGAGLADAAMQGAFGPPVVFLQYDWLSQVAGLGDPGSAGLVPVLASGPGARAVVAATDQAALGRALAAALAR
jgi:alkaline phosphatase